MNSILDVYSIDLTSPQLLHASLIRSSHSNRIQQKSMPINRLYCQLGYYMLPTTYHPGTSGNSIQPTSLPFQVATNFPSIFSTSKTSAPFAETMQCRTKRLGGSQLHVPRPRRLIQQNHSMELMKGPGYNRGNVKMGPILG